MDPRFEDVFERPENEIFRVVFYPDRIYHAQYLNATRSARYRYNVQEVRTKADITVMKGQVYLDGKFLANFLRLEYRSGRIVEMSRERGRLAQNEMRAWIRLLPQDLSRTGEAEVKLHLCRWTDSWQVEIWETLEPPPTVTHDWSVLDQMGFEAPITRVESLRPALADLKALKKLEVSFRENERDLVSGFRIPDPEWDNNYLSSHQEPRRDEPSSDSNTIDDKNYLIDFRRGWYLHADDVKPVHYRNAMMDPENPERAENNVIAMRWLLQREFGASVVFFHEVTIPPGTIEGTHWHIGSEELYYIVAGQGIAYLGKGDDPRLDEVDIQTGEPRFKTVTRHIYGVGTRECKELPVVPGSVIFTKSGGIHGIRNDGTSPLKFVAFLYHSS